MYDPPCKCGEGHAWDFCPYRHKNKEAVGVLRDLTEMLEGAAWFANLAKGAEHE